MDKRRIGKGNDGIFHAVKYSLKLTAIRTVSSLMFEVSSNGNMRRETRNLRPDT